MAKEKKPKSGIVRLFELASPHRGLLAVSGFFAALASVASFVPYIAVYLAVKEVISVYPSFSALDVSRITGYGLLAVAGIAADVICFLLSSICAHLAAFGTQYELKTLYTKHLAKIPLGYHLTLGTGRLRKSS